jgi:hypothetical protein
VSLPKQSGYLYQTTMLQVEGSIVMLAVVEV